MVLPSQTFCRRPRIVDGPIDEKSKAITTAPVIVVSSSYEKLNPLGFKIIPKRVQVWRAPISRKKVEG